MGVFFGGKFWGSFLKISKFKKNYAIIFTSLTTFHPKIHPAPLFDIIQVSISSGSDHIKSKKDLIKINNSKFPTAESAFMRDFHFSINKPDLVNSRDHRGKTSMNAENFSFDKRGD